MIYVLSESKIIQYTYVIIRRRCMSANKTTLHPSQNVYKRNHCRSKYGLQHGALPSIISNICVYIFQKNTYNVLKVWKTTH